MVGPAGLPCGPAGGIARKRHCARGREGSMPALWLDPRKNRRFVMSRRNLRRTLAVSALASTLTLCAPLRTEAAGFEVWQMASLWERGWSWLAGLWEKEGAEIDPFGGENPPAESNGGG